MGLVTMHVKKGDTFVFPQGSSHCSPLEALQLVVATRHAKGVRKAAPPSPLSLAQVSFDRVRCVFRFWLLTVVQNVVTLVFVFMYSTEFAPSDSYRQTGWG